MRIITLIILSGLFSCQNAPKKIDATTEKQTDSTELEIIIEKTDTTQTESINYFEFKPDTLLDVELVDFDIENAYQLDSRRILTGYDQKSELDSEEGWGDKLLLLNAKNEILFQSFGVGDVYSFEPHFYKNDKTQKVIIICQLAFEYCFGGEAYVLENETITYIGTIDLESTIEEELLTDIVEINEIQNEITFTFNTDSLCLEPGSENIIIKNTGLSYTYKNEQLILKKK